MGGVHVCGVTSSTLPEDVALFLRHGYKRGVADSEDLDHTLLRILLDKELAAFRRALEEEDPGLSEAEIERYMRAASKFAARLSGDAPRTRGRQLRSSGGDS